MKKRVSVQQIAGIKEYAKTKNRDTIDKVNKTIDLMKRKGKQINFETVSKEAGVSRATLYNNAQLKERISSLRAVMSRNFPESTPEKIKDKYQLQEEKIRVLRDMVNKLEQDKKKLIAQLVDYEELKTENEKLKAQWSIRK